MKKRNILSSLLLVSFLITFCYRLLPPIVHEITGVALVVLTGMHLYFNRSWLRSLAKGRYTARRVLTLTVNAALLSCSIAIVVTGTIISHHLFTGVYPLSLARNLTIHQLHVSRPYMMLILIGIHLGLHWPMIWQQLKTRMHLANEGICRIAGYLAVVAFIALGGCSISLNQIAGRIMGKHVFTTPAIGYGLGVFIALLLAFIAMNAVIGYALHKALSKKA